MSITDTILTVAKQKKQFKTADILNTLKYKVSRQTVALEIGKLVRTGELLKGGSTKSAFYFLPQNLEKIGERIKKKMLNKNLEEHRVFVQFRDQSAAIKNLPENVFSIVQYGFDEMLNNAIEHSLSKNIEIETSESKENLSFVIRDFGIGAFRNILKKRHLKSELEAIQDVLKGKMTTAPRAHSGEGIFFTSKVMDIFILESFGWRLRIDNLVDDIFIEEVKPLNRGTQVSCSISNRSKRHLSDTFKKFESDDGEMTFDKTEVLVRLFTMGTVYVSRSQARRILIGLDKFKTVIMDFDKVPTVGQAFADEIFRVFAIHYPQIKIIPTNMNKTVEFMIKRVEKPNFE